VRDKVSHPYKTTGKIIVLYNFADPRNKNSKAFTRFLNPSREAPATARKGLQSF
jgi:hypothetical protein